MKRILFASVDIGWRISNYSSLLKRKLGRKILIRSFIKRGLPKKQYQTNYDYTFEFHKYPAIVQWLISFCFFIYALLRFDVLYFLSGETILTRKTRKIEFAIYKLFGKKIIMHFVGTDIRHSSYLYWKDKMIKEYLSGNAERKMSVSWQDELIADSLQYASRILVSTPDLLKIIPTADYFPVMLDVEKFKRELDEHSNSGNKLFRTDKIKILHAPSNISIKGSSIIEKVVKELAEKDERIEFIYTKDLERNTGLTYTVTRYELFQLYREADIVIDQLIIGWYGLQSVEALMAKCQVLCYIEEDLKKHLYPDCPIIQTDALRLEEDIKLAVQNAINGSIDFQQQEKWVAEYHSLENNHQILLNAIEN